MRAFLPIQGVAIEGNGCVAALQGGAGGGIGIAKIRIRQGAGCIQIQLETRLIGDRADEVFKTAFRIEAHSSSGKAETSFIDESRAQRRTKRHRVRKSIRTLAADLRKTGESLIRR